MYLKLHNELVQYYLHLYSPHYFQLLLIKKMPYIQVADIATEYKALVLYSRNLIMNDPFDCVGRLQ